MKTNIDGYEVVIGQATAGHFYCTVTLNLRTTSYRSGLKELARYKYLEGRDDPKDVDQASIDKMVAWASEQGYQIK